MVNSNGLMEENIKDIGKMENNTEGVFILEATSAKERENGMKEKELDGFKKKKMLLLNERKSIQNKGIFIIIFY